MTRKIIHIDMDAFFASVEQRDRPELRGKAVAVGGSAARGVVAAASYEARKYGVRSAMPSVTAIRKCPHLIFVKPRFEIYRQVSLQIRSVFQEFTPIIEPLSLDEAYLDVTENLKGLRSAINIANQIKQLIFERTQLTASAGVSYNKFLAKIASDYNKPNGLFVITPEEGEQFVSGLKIEKFHGIGKVTAERMKALGIYTGADLKTKSEAYLKTHFGKVGTYYYNIARGIDNRPVEVDRIRKSSGAETTFSEDITAVDVLKTKLLPLIEEVWEWAERTKIFGRTVTVKIKFTDFKSITRSRSSTLPIQTLPLLQKTAFELLEEGVESGEPVRLVGVSISNLEDLQPYDGKQLTLEF